MSLYHGEWGIGKKKFWKMGLYKRTKRCYNTQAFKKLCTGGSMDRASDSGSEGWGFESLPVYQKFQIPIRVSGIFAISRGRGSNIKMQQSGGLLLMPGSTGMTPSLPSIPGRQCKRVPSGVPRRQVSNFGGLFLLYLPQNSANQ